MNTEKEFEDVKIEKPSWRRWPIVFLFSLYGCHYSFQVRFQIRRVRSRTLLLLTPLATTGQ